jgi:DNA-binding transcriptional MerR regulator
MTYTVQQLATLAGITTRTLHHYDDIGLLKPARVQTNGYRQYGEAELLKLQQIMLYRELEFPLREIQKIINNPKFDISEALVKHRKLIELKKKQMGELLKTIDKTLTKINHQNTMDDKELYDGFSKEQMEEYAKEAKERWGTSDTYKQSVGKYEKLTMDQKLQMKKDADALMKEIASHMGEDPASTKVQALIDRHFNSLRFFYEPTIELYRGLATMYVDDPRFKAYYTKYHPDLAEFMRDAMHSYCNARA